MTGIYEDTAVIILAAGKGTRMKSDRAKVLHELNAVPMIQYVVKTALSITPNHVFIVVGHQADQVERTVAEHFRTHFVLQAEQKGTGHAVQCALPYVSENIENIVVLCGDVPLLTPDTVRMFLNGHRREQNDITILAVSVDNPKGYGRVIFNENGKIEGIVEEADADEHQKKITLINAGIYCAKKAVLESVLAKIKSNNAQNELYLTDIVGIGYRENLRLGVEIGQDPREVIGINDIDQLSRVEKILLGKSSETA